MAELPEATVTIDDTASAFAGGTGYIVVMACVAQNDDITPRVFSSTKGLLETHLYSPGADFCAHHFKDTKKPVLFVGLPVATAGTVGRQNNSGVTGNSVITVSAGTNGIFEETDAILTVTVGGTISTNGIAFTISLDGGRTEKLIRLGTATSYTVPHVGIVINFAAGTLIAGDVYTFSTTAPMWDQAGLQAAREALAEQLKLARSFMIVGDIQNSTFAGYITTEVNAYETENDRFVYARAQVRDHLPVAESAQDSHTMRGDPILTFAASGDTITRATGSWIADGFAVGDHVTFSDTDSNDVSSKITTLTTTIMTVGNVLADEGPTAGHACVGSHSFVFDAATDTITRSGGSWLADGFRVGDEVTVTGTASNNFTKTITVLTATVMTFASGLADETIGSRSVTIVKGETMAQWMAAMDAAFTSVDGERRLDLAAGRARAVSPITGWMFRRPAAWPMSLREYQHDVHIPCWRKSDGPLSGWSLEDEDGNIVEFDERTDGGGLAGRFSCLRTYGNGPNGTFVALSLTRATEGSLLSRTHNMAVANVVCTVTQAESENAIGQVLVLNDDGTASEASLGKFEERVNSALQRAVLQDKGEGPRATSAVYRASRTAILNVPAAELPGTVNLEENGTLEKLATSVRVQTGG